MTTIRVASRKRYTSIANDTVENSELSWEARGLLVYLLSKPDDWQVSRDHLVTQATNGITQVRRILKELADGGYLVRRAERDEDGHVQTVTYLYEVPQRHVAGEEVTSLPPGVFPARREPCQAGTVPGGAAAGRFPARQETDQQVLSTEKALSTEDLQDTAAPQDDEFPLKRAQGLTYARTIAAWLRDQGVKVPSGKQRDDAFRTVMSHLALAVPDTEPRKTGAAIGIVCEYVVEVTGSDLDGEAKSHLGRLVKSFGPEPAFNAIVEAVQWGAGIGEKYANDPRALTKYATTVCKAAA